jgi:hypothetical protein
LSSAQNRLLTEDAVVVSAFLPVESRFGVDLFYVATIVMVIAVVVVTVVVVGVMRFLVMLMIARRVMHVLLVAVVMCGMMLVRKDPPCAEAPDRRHGGTGQDM